MVAIIPRPGIVADLAKEGSLISLDDLGLDADKINENYGEAWTEAHDGRRDDVRRRREGELEERRLVPARRLEGASRSRRSTS